MSVTLALERQRLQDHHYFKVIRVYPAVPGKVELYTETLFQQNNKVIKYVYN